MYTILICVIICCVWMVVSFTTEFGWGFSDVLFGLFCGVFLGSLAGFVVCLILSTIPAHKVTEHQPVYLESLDDSNQLEGRFFLGSGVIGGRPYYTFYYKTGESRFAYGQISADRATIIYDSGSPRYVESTSELVNKAWNNWTCSCGCSTYEIYVPKGTIKQGFSLDLK